MSYYGAGLHKFITGETRVDGWKSPWRIDLERRMAEEALKPRTFVKAKQVIERKISVVPRNSAPRYSAPRKCVVCGSGIRQDNKTGRCGDHRAFRQSVSRKTCPYTGCGNHINHKNLYGICTDHFHKFRGLLKQKEVRVCAEEGCFNVMFRNCTLTRCRKHAKAERRVIETLRMRKVRERQKELKKAA